ncbi:dipeptide epimerase [Guptibacillus algicola]|uniref:dipeptide epimerase n=1 Tax=Guptibacillus algicola TaxID=225844 RepID=UPI001CD1A4F0|nr:dipeptide epimerase [Alkalihalobacillus algicola]MCA0988241.1 dipeptide epimerase [Alkalihalobacillus algicola]
MKINDIETFIVNAPLKKPFKTALRTVTNAESVIVNITAGDQIGWGEAPPTLAITGESIESVKAAITNAIAPKLIGLDLSSSGYIFDVLHTSLVGNTSAKAAVDMAIYDLLAKKSDMPLYQFLGGYRDQLETDYTVSVNSPEEMGDDAVQYIDEGFSILKVKVGKDTIHRDIERIITVQNRTNNKAIIRLDANQGWTAKEAIYAIRKMEEEGLQLDLVEQPVHASDIEGLKRVTDSVSTPIMADESVFSPHDALKVIMSRAADLINIKLMKAGGIHQALKINAIAESAGIECMVGSMIESKVGITAAAHFAASQRNITRYDFDAPLMFKEENVEGGVTYNKSMITFNSQRGLGIHSVKQGGLEIGIN